MTNNVFDFTYAIKDEELNNYIRAELDDGMDLEEFFEQFDLTPEQIFVYLFHSGMIDEEILESRLLDFE